ncbi:hypothetical protein WL40_03375 [Burkholderia ubonensis]|uniref:DUF1493 family protein n=1 Tax=Burkholderia ubonensis TaxID=101571 RepID=UPI000753B002|nr:DUF1493 family protein [Burkholderia ubonensis]KVM07261.1 hypothetical protein WJ51_23860 [Burkholderia ubonensis]KVM11732.1 hypothetical protein WJ52_00915 [Burkholderia ubonensis]KVM44392.1 hypothetical protein WJ56_27605 [Burkholderia ubonensis]KVO03236.1 hypothetical protein WJ69_27620 [Burkholderia ubonensis]KVO11398.1 hypothetical protein WJ72_18410 [Burkholderia ubonensis]
MEKYTWDDLVAFIRQEACMPSKKPITDDMDVVHSLGQHGDDANDFMEKFFETFTVDRGDYDFCRYFFMEGEGFISHLFKKYILRKPHSLKRETVTVGMLHKAALNHKWDCKALSENKFH